MAIPGVMRGAADRFVFTGVKRLGSIFCCSKALEVGFPCFFSLAGVPEGRLGSLGLGEVFVGGEMSSLEVLFIMVVDEGEKKGRLAADVATEVLVQKVRG